MDTPIWVQFTIPFVTAIATWSVSKLDLISLGGVQEYTGQWYAYYRDPDSGKIESEIWAFSKLGAVTVSRNGSVTFNGKLTIKGAKAYMYVTSAVTKRERLFVTLNAPTNPRTGEAQGSACIWLGEDGSHRITAGHALLSRKPIHVPKVPEGFMRAASMDGNPDGHPPIE